MAQEPDGIVVKFTVCMRTNMGIEDSGLGEPAHQHGVQSGELPGERSFGGEEDYYFDYCVCVPSFFFYFSGGRVRIELGELGLTHRPNSTPRIRCVLFWFISLNMVLVF